MYFCRLQWFSFNKSQAMKKILLICAVLLVVFPSCFRKNGKTHHHIETDGYTLAVNGQRIFSDEQLAAIPKDTIRTIGDTVTFHEDVTSGALLIEELSQNLHSCSEPVHSIGDYILDLELIHHPGSDHAANASAVLANLRDWGYITIDTTDWQDIFVVRHGTLPEDYDSSKPDHCYGSIPNDIHIPDELLLDSINDVTLEQWLQGWMDSFLSTDEELVQFLTTHGYDTINAGFSHRQIYPHATRKYEASGLLYHGGRTAAKLMKTAKKIAKKVRESL